MATLLLSAAGAAIGGSVGGSALGLGAAVVGRAVGATLGTAIDQRLLGSGSQKVSGRRLDRFRVQGASEGEGIARVFGRMRLPAHVIWSSNFRENRTATTSSSKSSSQTVEEFSYSVSLALALCEGEITRIGRVWADGNLINLDAYHYRLYRGSEAQEPDGLIESIEGTGTVPAYRGLAYIVIENLDLAAFGNRIPQFNFEVIRHTAEAGAEARPDPFRQISGVALVPGSGEYALATTPVTMELDKGLSRVTNVNNEAGRPDIDVALDHLAAELPQVNRASLVVSWFGDDLRSGRCTIRPAVEQRDTDGVEMPWVVSSTDRYSAPQVNYTEGRPAFGGTPADGSVIEAIEKMNADGVGVMFYPFLLMDVPAENPNPDPWSPGSQQPAFPWRGRITLDVAPGLGGTSDQTAQARADIRQFFGDAVPSDFSINGQTVDYSGPPEWSYRRFVLHYAFLCMAAGGVHAFCIGSEMRSLTQIRDDTGAFPAVDEFVRLAEEVREILGPATKIGYASDWSEYFGYRPSDGSGDVLFHLDPLWASPAIDFVGIDNYMPLSDWRDEQSHADADAGSIYSLDYLTANVAGGEGYDWYYANAADRKAQVRTPIVDTAHGEDWVFRYKDLYNWWRHRHYDRPGGVRSSVPTAWEPKSKPIWFTELGCGAIDKGTNQPNVFLDPKSSESYEPYFSSGSPDHFIQYRYFQAHMSYWFDPANNPFSPRYGGQMVDTAHIFVWAWDTRPWPDFPIRTQTWSDGDNYRRGHWISGRTSMAVLSGVVSQLAENAGVTSYDVSKLYGAVSGYLIDGPETARQSLEPLMLSHAFDARETGAGLEFRNRSGIADATLQLDSIVADEEAGDIEAVRTAEAEVPARVEVGYYDAENDYQVGAGGAAKPGALTPDLARTELPIALEQESARAIAKRWIAEADVSRDTASFAIPRSSARLVPGDVVKVEGLGKNGVFRIDRLDDGDARALEAVRVDPSVYWSGPFEGEGKVPYRAPPPGGMYAEILELPLITGEEKGHAPYVAATSSPWPGAAALYVSEGEGGFSFSKTILNPSIVGTTVNELPGARPDLWQHSGSVSVRVPSGVLMSATRENVLNGANLMAVRNGDTEWEVFQFLNADLIDHRTYRLSGFLRGQFGTEHLIPASYPAGSDVVLLDGAAVQADVPVATYDIPRTYRIGHRNLAPDHPLAFERTHTSSGVGLRPYAPCHLRARRSQSGSVEVSWVRRTRIGGDSWSSMQVPLGEEREAYVLRVSAAGSTLREAEISTSQYVYTVGQQATDSAPQDLTLEVAQISDTYGYGPFSRIDING